MFQAIIKLHTILSNYKLFDKLLELNNKKFWRMSIVSEEERKKLQKVYELTKNSVYICHLITLSALFSHIVSSLIKSKPDLLFNIWLPQDMVYWRDNQPGYEILIIIQSIILIIIVFCVLENDSIFIIFIGSVLTQLKIVKIRLETLGSQTRVVNIHKTLTEIIEHHILIFE